MGTWNKCMYVHVCVQNSCGNSRGVGWRGHFSGRKKKIPRREGASVKFPLWWAYPWIFSGTTHFKFLLDNFCGRGR